MAFNIAVVGATGNVGKELLSILAERNFPVGEVVALASERSVGKEVSFGDDKILKVQNLADFDFSNTDIGLFSPGASVSKKYAPIAADQGCVVIDNTSQFRMDDDVPLVVPEVNGHLLNKRPEFGIIANPNCSTIQMMVALAPIHHDAKIKRVVVSTYQSVSGSGKSAMDELYEQTKSMYSYDHKDPINFPKRIAFNAIPHIDMFMDDGATKEEWKMRVETKKILDESIELHANCVRLPVFVGHGEMINIETEQPLTVADAHEIWEEADGISIVDRHEDGGYVTPAECAGEDSVYISRVRKDHSVANGLSFWCVSDNMRKGAALNTIQIAEELISRGAIKPRS